MSERWPLRSWDLQTLQDHIAHGLGLPLQLCSVSAGREWGLAARNRFPESDFAFAAFQNAESLSPLDFAQFVDDNLEAAQDSFFNNENAWRNYFSPVSLSSWMIPGSNVVPAVRLFRDHWSWRWLECLIIYNAVQQCYKKRTDHFSLTALFNDFLCGHAIRCFDDIVLVSGPTFALPDSSIAHRLIADRIDRGVKRLGRVIEPRFPHYPGDKLKRTALLRPLMNNDDLQTSSYLSAEALERSLLGAAAIPEFDRTIDGLYSIAAQSTKHISEGDSSEQTLRPLRQALLRLVRSTPSRSIRREVVALDLHTKSSEEAAILEQFLLLRTWLNDQFGLFVDLEGTEEPQTDHPASTSKLVSARRTARWLADLVRADVATLYKYNYLDGVVSAIGVHVGASVAANEDHWTKKHPSFMRDVGAPGRMIDRRRSIVYRAFDSQRSCLCQSYDPVTEAAVPPSEPMLTLPGTKIHAKSAIAMPIYLMGRSWGVLEVLGRYPFQFSESFVARIEEAASIVGVHYYYQDLLAHLGAASAIAFDASLTLNQKLDQLCRLMMSVFLCESAALWVRDRGDQFSYTCQSRINRPDMPDSFADGPGFNLQRSEDVAKFLVAHCIKSRRAFVNSRLGEEPFDEAWLSRRNHETLVKAGFRSGAILLIQPKHGNDSPVAALTLFSKTERLYEDSWTHILSFVSAQLANTIQTITQVEDWEYEGRRLVVHEVSFRTRTIASSAAKILREYEQKVPEAERDLNVERAIGDLRLAAEELDHYNEILERRDLRKGLEVGEDPAMQLVLKVMDGKAAPIDLRSAFTQVFQSTRHRYRKKRMLADWLYPRGKEVVRVHMHLSNMQNILTNLADNAFKYGEVQSAVLGRVQLSQGKVVLSVANRGPRLFPREIHRLFDRGYRGELAVKSGIPGTGRGLNFVKQICDLYGIDISYSELPERSSGMTKPSNTQRPMVWHAFFLTFPREMAEIE